MLNAFFLLLVACNVVQTTPLLLNTTQNHLTQLRQARGGNATEPLKLHLGCGERRLAGFVNLDFPPEHHTVQQQAAADVWCDITQLALPKNSVATIRSHHVFEHFDRAQALALLTAWHEWLMLDGVLIIETPDFAKSIQLLQNPHYSYAQKQVIMRHIFGSHEAPWAIHCDGWYTEKFTHVLAALGFEIEKADESQWLLTVNITITARKKRSLSSAELEHAIRSILATHLVDASTGEQRMLAGWMEQWTKKRDRMRVSA